MKEDYLWDKTGKDTEIERLENTLRAFRYQESEPPALPAKIIPLEKKPWYTFFRPSFALAGFATLMLVCLGVWFQSSPAKIEIAKDSTEVNAPQTEKKIPDEIPIQKSDDLIVEKVAAPNQIVKRNFVKISKIVPAKAHQANLTARNVEAKKPSVKLTKEEKYAYDQLMLALSITGSKLKLVSDKIEGVEEKTNVDENGR